MAKFWQNPPMGSSDWAAWAQAAGTVAALFAGVALFHYQSGFQRRQRRSCAAATIGVAIFVLDTFTRGGKEFDDSFAHFVTDFSPRMRSALDALKGFPTSDIDSAEAIVQIAYAVEIMQTVVDKFSQKPALPMNDVRGFETELRKLRFIRERVLAAD
ncbi:hypothetical protein [Pandoraea sp. PE-S2R-1]|uniref:hypothetical protein n=1 Tax=Pandoraea sp. PE-S2R-1 TaxID=1986994 RepID=UPI0011312C8A|nr:hypothetical protein [Pandoraea sp. PE-S2R-1]